MSYNFSPRIVTDGLVLYLDAANTKSYLGSGTIWTDLSRNNYNVNLINSPTFDTINNGIIKSDGVDSYVQVGTTFSDFQIPPTWSYCGFVYCNLTITTILTRADILGKGTTNGNSGVVLSFRGGVYNGLYFRLTGSAPTPPNTDVIPTIDYSSVVSNKWSFVCVTKSIYEYKLYLNGNLLQTLTDPYSRDVNNNTNTLKFMGGDGASVGQKVWLGPQIMYNRTLSATEIIQNYNALKSRYNLN
jgi:hypothetical protein